MRTEADQAPSLQAPGAYGLSRDRDQWMDFMVDTGAEYSAVTRPVGPLSKNYTTIIGVTGMSEKEAFLSVQEVHY